MNQKMTRLRAFAADLQEFRNDPKRAASFRDPKARVTFDALVAAVKAEIEEVEVREFAAQ